MARFRRIGVLEVIKIATTTKTAGKRAIVGVWWVVVWVWGVVGGLSIEIEQRNTETDTQRERNLSGTEQRNDEMDTQGKGKWTDW